MMRRLFVTLLIMAPLSAWALTLDEAKQSGLVGEEASGYVGAVSDKPTKEVKELVADVNAKRRAAYEKIVAANKSNGENEVTLDSVEKLAGKKLIESSPAGDYIRLPGQSWRRK